MKVGQVIELAKEWVELEGRRTPGFHGAHLMGSIVAMPRDTPFTTYRDVDLSVVVPDGSGRENLDLPYKGLILEVSFHGLEKYGSPEAVLINPSLAPHLAVDSILSDPTGELQALHKAVARDYARRRWVLARCEHEKDRFSHCLAAMRQADECAELAIHLLVAFVYVTGIIAVACLRQPTNRRSLILMQELLAPQDRMDPCEEALRVLGSACMTRPQVEAYVDETMRSFDRAAQVHCTRILGGFKLRPHVRPYVMAGAREMIREGHHREAMWWICWFHGLANAGIQNDAPDDEKAQYQVTYDRLLESLGLSAPEDSAARVEQVSVLSEKVFQVADEIVAQNPEIVDRPKEVRLHECTASDQIG